MKKNTILSILLFHISIYVSDLFPQEEIKVENYVKLEYTHTESRDVMKVGDVIGYRIILYFDGKIEKHNLIFMKDEILVAGNKLNKKEISELDRLFAQYNFLKYPEKIPWNKRILWPSTSYQIKYSLSINRKLKIVSFSSNSDQTHLPYNHGKFINALRVKLLSFFR